MDYKAPSPLAVLILEDSPDDARLLELELKREGYQLYSQVVQTATDFVQALEHQAWHLIVSDYSMPGFTGLEALNILRRYEFDIPFIMISGFAGEDIAVEVLKAGAHDFIVKTNRTRLLPAVARELREAADRNARREIEARFRVAEERLHLALEAARITIWEWDIVNDRVTYGDYYENLFGDPPPLQPQGYQAIMERIHPDDRDQVIQAVKATLDQDEPFRVDYRVRWQDGTIHWLQSQGRAHRNSQQQPVNMAGVLQNVTEQKRIRELELEQVRLQQVVETEREISGLQRRFMAMVAHEFRTPLTVISSASELLNDYHDEISRDKQREYLLEILDRVKHLREILTQIESVTRDEYVSMECTPYPTNVVALSLRLIQEVEVEYNRPGAITIHNESEGVEYPVDGRLVSHILSHLLTNALKFSRRDAPVKLILRQQDEWLILKVVDRGIGILPAEQPRIFDLFYRGTNVGATGGRGMGLKIAQDCTRAHGGVIEVASEPGQGSTFTVRLPLVETPSINHLMIAEED